jgi:hypothetical protein
MEKYREQQKEEEQKKKETGIEHFHSPFIQISEL